MTTCELITKPIKRMVEEEGKSLAEISEVICPKTKYGKEKIIRIIKDFMGEKYLIQHAQTLEYDVEKAKLAKKRTVKSQEKIDATTDNGSIKKEVSNQPSEEQNSKHFDKLLRLLKKLVDRFSLPQVKKAVALIEQP
jgi:chromatin remodeling complex protein RSC6